MPEKQVAASSEVRWSVCRTSARSYDFGSACRASCVGTVMAGVTTTSRMLSGKFVFSAVTRSTLFDKASTSPP